MSPSASTATRKPPLTLVETADAPNFLRRRGPLRPDALVPARARVSAEGFGRAFQLADALILALLTLFAAAAAAEGRLLDAEMALVAPFAAAGLVAAWCLRGFGAYGFGSAGGLAPHMGRIAAASAAAMVTGLLAMSLFSTWRGLPAVLIWSVAAWAAVSVLHLGGWELARHWRRSGRMRPNLVFVGATPNARRLIESALATREVAVLGVFDDRADRAPLAIHGVPVLGDTEALLNHRIMPYVDRVVITVSTAAEGRVRDLIQRLRTLPNEVTLFIDAEGAERPTHTLSRVTAAPLTFWTGSEQGRAFYKRLQDVVIAGAALIVAAPVMGMVAIAVALDTPGPVLFRQRRHGFNNETITVWKFRSMRHEMTDHTARKQVVENDKRVTRVGRFIRRTSLDELPQLFNVLTGEMSIVGPRPHPIGMRTGEAETARLVAEYAHRHRLKPGVTGWAQINGSRGPVHTPEEVRRRVTLDIEYIERQSLWLDLYIVLMTIPCLLGDKAAIR